MNDSTRHATELFDENRPDAYATKYAEGMDEFGTGLDGIVEQYNTVIIVTPTKLMAW